MEEKNNHRPRTRAHGATRVHGSHTSSWESQELTGVSRARGSLMSSRESHEFMGVSRAHGCLKSSRGFTNYDPLPLIKASVHLYIKF